MSIRCGNHTEKTYHPSITDVRACFAGAVGGEQTYEDVILTTSELAKIDAGIRDMEREGILPRTGRTSTAGIVEALTRAAGSARTAATAPVGYMERAEEIRLSPKGRKIAEGFGGSPKQYDYMYDLMEELGGVSENFRWDVVVSVRLASKEIDRLKDAVRDARRMALVERRSNDYGAVYSDGAVEDAPRKPVRQVVTGQVTEDGIYRNPATGELFKVQVAVHGSGNLYAKQAFLSTLEGNLAEIPLTGDRRTAEEIEWVYKPGMLGKIKAEWKVTREEAVAFGALYGQCIRCGRTLTNEDSIEAAIGPVCRGKLGF